jgi:hypothetical protein
MHQNSRRLVFGANAMQGKKSGCDPARASSTPSTLVGFVNDEPTKLVANIMERVKIANVYYQ